MHKKEEILPRYSELIYNGYWFSKERKQLQKVIDTTQKKVDGTVVIKLIKGNLIIQKRISKKSIYSKSMASFEGKKTFNPKNVEKFIKSQASKL